MMHKRMATLVAAAVLVFIAGAASAEHHEGAAEDAPAMSGYLADFKKDVDATAEKLKSLGEAIPEDKYSWAPSEEVRTVSRQLVHVAMGNYFFASQFGVEMPEGLGRDAEEKVTAKGEVLELLEKSFGHVHEAAAKAAAMDLDEEIEFFGQKRSKRAVLMIAAGHAHEHLGNLIAYARSNGVVPPWSVPPPASDG